MRKASVYSAEYEENLSKISDQIEWGKSAPVRLLFKGRWTDRETNIDLLKFSKLGLFQILFFNTPLF